MKKIIANTKLISLALALMLLASFTALAAPGGNIAAAEPVTPETLSGGVIYEDEYIKVEYVEEEPEAQQNRPMSVMAATGSVSMSVSTPNLVAGFAANLNVTLTGQSIPNGTATVYLDVNGQKIAETAIVGNKARMSIESAHTIIGTYYVVAWGQDGFIAQTPVEILAYDTNIWTPDIRPAQDSNKTIVSFIESVSAKDGTLTDKITVNGVKKTAAFGADGYSIIINYPYGDLREGDKIGLANIKYPRLFPSYSFTFTITYTEGVRYQLSMTAGDVYYIAVTAFEKADMNAGKYTVTYDPGMVELLDAAAQTSQVLYRGTAEGAGINIQSHDNGVLIFNSTRPEENYSGVLTLLKFRAKAGGETTVMLRHQ